VSAAQTAKEYGADLIGFVFAKSRRNISPVDAKKIAEATPGIAKVGVFVNAPLGEVQEIAKECKLDFVQLHGDESPEYCRLVRYPVIKAVRVGLDFDPLGLGAYDVEWLLLDSFVPGQQGGTGTTFDWQQTQKVREQIKHPLFVAGGLTVENVGEAIRILTPQGIDVSGGVETNGSKDNEKIRQFLLAARREKGGEVYDITKHCYC
jgi:phosphoribosylanthranilate isomerase